MSQENNNSANKREYSLFADEGLEIVLHTPSGEFYFPIETLSRLTGIGVPVIAEDICLSDYEMSLFLKVNIEGEKKLLISVRFIEMEKVTPALPAVFKEIMDRVKRMRQRCH